MSFYKHRNLIRTQNFPVKLDKLWHLPSTFWQNDTKATYNTYYTAVSSRNIARIIPYGHASIFKYVCAYIQWICTIRNMTGDMRKFCHHCPVWRYCVRYMQGVVIYADRHLRSCPDNPTKPGIDTVDIWLSIAYFRFGLRWPNVNPGQILQSKHTKNSRKSRLVW